MIKPQLTSLKLPRLKLYQQIIVCFVAVVLIPLLGVSFIIYNINQKALKKELAKFTEHTAESLYKDLETEMSWQQSQTRILGAYLLDTYQAQGNFDAAAQRVFEQSPAFEAVGIYNTQGEILAKSYRNFAHLSPELRLPAELKPLTSHPMQFEVLYAGDPQLNGYYLRSTVPVNRGATAYYVILKRFKYLQDLIRDNTNTLHSGVYIIDETGTIIAGPALEATGENQQISPEDYAFFQKIQPGVTEEHSTKSPTRDLGQNDDDEDPKPLQKVFVKMPNIDWGIIIESPYNVRQAYVKRARTQSLLLIIACLVVVILLALFYILGINRNFRQLIKAIKAMAEGNYSRRIRLITNTTTPYEIVYLAGEFNRMGKKMSEAWKNSQTLNQELLRRNEEEAFLNRIAKALHGTLSLKEIQQITTQKLGDYLDADVCVLVIQTAEESSTASFWLWENGQHPEITLQEIQAFSPQGIGFFFQNHPILCETEKYPWLEAFNMGSALLQPILYQEQPFGSLLILRNREKLLFSPEELHLTSLVANQIGVAVHQAHQWETIQEANRKLAKLDEFKSNLIDTVSHELRTPLTSIKGYTSRLLRYDAALDGDTRTKSLKVIKQQADRLGRLVEDLLVIPDLESANLRVFPDQVGLFELLETSVQFIQEKEHREIHIYSQMDTAVDVLADPDRLEQVLLNLLDNAVKYSEPETPIEVSVHQEEAMVYLTVSNQCDPIPQESLATLFEKFKRLDERLTRTTRGSGLGLFITRGLVEAMGGAIGLDYQDGRFHVHFTVPLYQEAPALTI